MKEVLERYDKLVILPEFEDAMLGVDVIDERCIYSIKGIMAILEQKMSKGDAREWFDYNVLGLHFKENGPLFCDDVEY